MSEPVTRTVPNRAGHPKPHPGVYNRPKLRRDLVVYKASQAEAPQEYSPEDQAKLKLLRLMNDARKTIQARVNALPGSMASNELYLRFKQVEARAAALGQAGLWSQAYDQFVKQYTVLLTAAPTGSPEPIGRGVGHSECCGPNCNANCAKCKRKNSRSDVEGLLKRATDALGKGDTREARSMLARARHAANSLEPNDLNALRGSIDVVANKLGAQWTQQDRVRGRSHVRSGVGYSSELGFVPNSWADDVNKRLDGVLSQAESLGGSFSTLSGATQSSSVFLSSLTGEAQQQAIGNVLDALNEARIFELDKFNGGFIEPGEHEYLLSRIAKIRSYISKKGTEAWQESAPFRKSITILGGITSSLGLTTPQSGEDTVAKKRVDSVIGPIRDVLSGNFSMAWSGLGLIGKGAVVAGAALVAYKAKQAVL